MTFSNPSCGISEIGHFLSVFGMISSFFGKSGKQAQINQCLKLITLNTYI